MNDLKLLLEKYAALEDRLKFARISDDIWQLGSLEEIKKEVSHETFIFHIAVNMIGNWQGDGWNYIFAEGHTLLPYISETFNELELLELKSQFDNTIFWLEEYFANTGVKFLNFEKEPDEKAHFDVINFLSSPRFKVEDEKLNYISAHDRKILSKKYKDEIGKLEEISEKLWGYGTEENGWKHLLDYIRKIFSQ